MTSETNEQDKQDKRYTVRDAIKYLGISDTKLRKVIKAKEITHYRIGTLIKFNREDLDNWLEKQKVQAETQA